MLPLVGYRVELMYRTTHSRSVFRVGRSCLSLLDPLTESSPIVGFVCRHMSSFALAMPFVALLGVLSTLLIVALSVGVVLGVHLPSPCGCHYSSVAVLCPQSPQDGHQAVRRINIYPTSPRR